MPLSGLNDYNSLVPLFFSFTLRGVGSGYSSIWFIHHKSDMISGSPTSPRLIPLVVVTLWNFRIAELNISIIIIITSIIIIINIWSVLSSFTFAVRAGTGGDEAGIWAGDLVGTCFYLSFLTHAECMKNNDTQILLCFFNI